MASGHIKGSSRASGESDLVIAAGGFHPQSLRTKVSLPIAARELHIPACFWDQSNIHRENTLLPGSHPEVQVLESKEGGAGEPEAFWVQEVVCAKALRLWLYKPEQLNRDHCETGWP